MAYQKLKITKPQADAVKDLAEKWEDNSRVIEVFKDGKNGSRLWADEHECLDVFTLSDFLLVMLGEYEIVPSFDLDDWVKSKTTGNYYQLSNFYGVKGKLNIRNVDNAPHEFEKVTDPFAIKLLELGRSTPTLRRGDVFIDDTLRSYIVSSKRELFEGIQVIYPKESRLR